MLRKTKVENGYIQGIAGSDPRITIYKGVPFAAPPTGKNRFRAPQPCEDWEGTRTCFEFAPISVQSRPGGTDLYSREWHVDSDIPMDEDCLYLNVWTPANGTDEMLPVLVWYFGGGFQWGYTAEMEFDGEKLARRGIVVVSVNYRLGPLGFMAHPEITKESPDAPANFGLMDQQAGLHWVYRNIEAFGGDPERITIAGQSAGGSSVMHQLANKDNSNIIKGAAIFSGMIRNPDEDSDIFRPLNLEKAEKKGEEFFSYLGINTLEEARNMDVFELRAKYDEYTRTNQGMFPIEDGKFCDKNPMDKFTSGECPDIPIMSGNTSDEFLINGESIVEKSVKTAFLDADRAGCKGNHYYYRFDPQIPGDKDGYPGTFHSCDLWFFFESLSKCHRPYRGHHFDLARQMCDMFANFIKTGDPNGKGWGGEEMPLWKPYTAESGAEMVFDNRGAVPGKEGGLRVPKTGKKQGVNPYLPSFEYIPDGEPYVFGDRVYVYGSHDLFDGETFCLGDYVCWSAPVDDLGNWHYEGVIYNKTADPLNRDGHMCLYAPDVTVGPDGRYYLYYVLDKISIVSVAVCDTPAGRYEFLGYVHYPDGTKLGEKEGDEPQFDPGVITEDGKTYLYTGFCGQGDKSRSGAMVTVLDSDMLTVLKAPKIIVPGSCYSSGTEYENHAFFEAPSIRKKDGRYFFIYSSEVMHELCYATSDAPVGPFEYGGVLVSNCDMHISSYKPAEMAMNYGANNHGSIVEIGGEWYIFYHRHTNNHWFSRQGCAEKLEFNEDGSIIQAEITSCGLNGGPLCDAGEYPSYIACNVYTEKHAVYVEAEAPKICQEGNPEAPDMAYIRQLTDKSTVGYKYFDMKKVKGLRILTKGYFNGFAEIRLSPDGDVLGKIPISSANIWTAGECSFKEITGTNAIYITFTGSGSAAFKSFEFLH